MNFTEGFLFLCGGSERKEEDRITKTYFATVEHNAALQAFPKAVCVMQTHTQSIHSQESCVLFSDVHYMKKEVNILAAILFNMHLSLSNPTFSNILLVLLE